MKYAYLFKKEAQKAARNLPQKRLNPRHKRLARGAAEAKDSAMRAKSQVEAAAKAKLKKSRSGAAAAADAAEETVSEQFKKSKPLVMPG